MANGGDAEGGWPRVQYEAIPWKAAGDEVGSRRAVRAARGDYRAAVPPLIAKAPVVLSARVLALADDASRELTRFDSETSSITAPFASILLRTESASSSEVENLTSSAKQVALAEIGASRSGNAQLVVANVRAMKAAIALSNQLDEAAIVGMHDALLSESAPDIVGGWRARCECESGRIRARHQRGRRGFVDRPAGGCGGAFHGGRRLPLPSLAGGRSPRCA